MTALTTDSAIETTSTRKLRVLFVDDEASLLDGLRRSMRGMRHQWDMAFMNSGEQALELLDAESFDVVVTDMRMPRIDGLELLLRIRDLYPDMARLVLSGQTEMQTALRSVSIAQMFLHKPCEPDQIKNAIERTVQLTTQLDNEALRRAVARVDTLPSPPAVVERLNNSLANADVDVADVASTIATDVAMTAKILQLANSAFFGVSRAVSDVHDAITLLGISTVRDLAAASKLSEILSARSANAGTIADVETHNAAVARIASELCDDPAIARQAFSAAILHDIGELVIAVAFPEAQDDIRRRTESGEEQTAIELEVIGVTHADVGAHLLRLWGLPHAIVEAVAWHHTAPSHAPFTMNAMHAVAVAESVVCSGMTIDNIPADYLDALGCREALLNIIDAVNE